MRLQIHHTTTFSYSQLISEAYTEMRLRPVDHGGQTCLAFTLTTEPGGAVMQYIDRYGNDVRHFDTINPHQKLVVSAISDVVTPATFTDSQHLLSPLDEYDYLAPTSYTVISDSIREFSTPYMVADDPLASSYALMKAIHESLKYEPGITDVKTTAAESLALGRGVCQDFSHIMIAACRAHGLHARYVSGYLYSDRLVGDNAASHAWLDVFVPGPGWISFDPTHNSLQAEHYVRVAVGRDYADVPPTRGTFKGNAQESLEVKVAVKAL
jgi:transglutaminase-like putative cysteine protease